MQERAPPREQNSINRTARDVIRRLLSSGGTALQIVSERDEHGLELVAFERQAADGWNYEWKTIQSEWR